ncbi:MAG: CBS domain-containing protein [Chitinophagaceae bacterium]
MRTVKNILDSKQKPFNTIEQKAMVIDALRMLNTVNLSYLVVMDGEEYKGIFSERDYSRNVVLKGKSSSSSTVEEVMTHDVPMVSESDSVEQCINMINQHKTRYLLAYSDGDQKLEGIITIHDLLREVLNSKGDAFSSSLTGQLIDNDESGIY